MKLYERGSEESTFFQNIYVILIFCILTKVLELFGLALLSCISSFIIDHRIRASVLDGNIRAQRKERAEIIIVSRVPDKFSLN